MAENEKITTKLEVDVTDFKQGLSDANRAIRLANSEFDNATAGIGKWSASADGLRAKLTQLNKTLDAQEAAAEVLRAEYARVVAEQGENSKGAQELAIKLNKQEAACKKTASQISHYEGDLKGMEAAADGAADDVEALDKNLDGAASASKKADKAADDAEGAFSKMAKTAGNAARKLAEMGGKAVVAGIKGIAAAATATVGAMVGATESTREYRTEMGKLDTAFTTAGHSSATAEKTYKALQGVLGETEQAVEASNHLAKLADNEKDLQKWTDICTGVYATFGASLPIEGLTEAANETAKVGQVTGPLADALNWAGVSEDAFNEKLAACSSEQERQALITQTLNGLYSESAEKYRETNAEVIRANEANEAWTSTLAKVGAVIEPIVTDVKQMGTALLSDLLPGVEKIATAFRGLLDGDAGAADALGGALGGIITQLLGKGTELAPTVVQVAMSLITSVTTTLIGMLPQLVETGIQLIMSIIDGLVSAIPQVVDAIVDMIPKLTAALVSGIPKIINGAVQLLLAIIDAIPKILPPLIKALPQIIMSIVKGLLSNIGKLLDGAITLLLAICDAIPVLIKTLVPMLPEIVQKVVRTLVANIPTLLKGAIQLFMAILKALPQIQRELLKSMPKIIASIVKGLVAGIKDIASVGKDLIRGLWNGIKDMTGWITSKLKGFGNTVLKGIKKFFGIKSPSKVMANEVGKWLPAGLAVGVDKNTKPAIKAMAGMARKALGAANAELNGVNLNATVNGAAAGVRGAAGGTTYNFYQYNNSPKALSRAEIYRQTKNQLRFATASA